MAHVSNKLLLQELTPWLKKVKSLKRKGFDMYGLPPLPDTVGEGILQIVQGISQKANFCNYTYIDEMRSDAILNCISYIHNFNPEKSTNLFAYLYQITTTAFIRRINLEKKHNYIKDKLMIGSDMERTEAIERFESKQNEQKERAKTRTKSK
jgi:hypothetical protein